MTGDNLYIQRVLQRVSQRELARRIGVTHVSIGRWERGELPVPRDRVPHILTALYGNEVEAKRKSGGQRLVAA